MQLILIFLIILGLIISFYVDRHFEKIKDYLNSFIIMNKEFKEKTKENIEYIEDEIIQESLSPKLLSDEKLARIMPYIKRLNAGVQNKEISNIALMGSYGSGKSTILKNFENEYPEHKILSLSLGSYTKKKEHISDEDLNDKLENSLVKQMIYREKKKTLPYSRFKKINSVSKTSMLLFSTIILMLIISFTYLKNLLRFRDSLINIKWIEVHVNSIDIGFFTMLFASFFILSYFFIKVIVHQFKVSKLSIGNLSIEGEESNNSYFNKYIDEILYYFEVNSFNVVVIEDVDRFKNMKVFEHLRELNYILNNSKQIDMNITFIYALKEDIFSQIDEEVTEHESELRTKFFDLIIPIIPVVDTFNSRNHLLPMMGYSAKSTDEFALFLKDMSLYIQDLRLLTNIVNEYTTYLEIHDNMFDARSMQRLFSMVVLKNLNPSEYSDLQKSKGVIYEYLVLRKNEDLLISNLKEETEELKKELVELDRQNNINKVNMIKILFYDFGYTGDYEIGLKDTWLSISDITLEHINEILEEEEPINLKKTNNYYGNTANFSFNDFKKYVGKQDSLIDNEVKIVNSKISKNNTQLKRIKEQKLQEKIKEFPIIIKEISDEIKDEFSKDLVLYLLSNGHISEDYYIYLSIFYEGSMNRTDFNYLVKVKSGQVMDFDYVIINPKEVTDNLLVSDFEMPGILNGDMYMYLFSDDKIISGDLRRILINKFVHQENNEIINRLLSILDYDIEGASFFINLLMYYESIDILNILERFPRNKIEKAIIFIVYALYVYDKENLIDLISMDKFEGETYLDEYITSMPNFFVEIRNFIRHDELMEIFAGTHVLFSNINIDGLDIGELNSFISNELFDYDSEVLELILNYKKEDKTIVSSYTKIREYSNNELLEIINKEINQFVEYVLLPNKYIESDESMELLYKMNNLKNSLKESLIVSNSNVFEKIINFPKNIWNFMLQEERIRVNWENIMIYTYLSDNNIDVLQTIFKEEKNTSILLNEYEKTEYKKVIENFIEYLINSKLLNVSTLPLELLRISKYKGYNLNINEVTNLIENNLVEFKIEAIEEFRELELLPKLLLNYQDLYIENEDEIKLTVNEIISLIKGWDTSDLLRLINLLFNKEFPELFVDQKFIDTLLSEQIIITDEQMNKLINLNSSIDSVQEYFIFNINKGMLEQETIDTVLATIYETSIDTLTSDDFEVIFSQSFDSELFVKYLNFAFRKFKYSSEEYETIESWLKKQDSPYNQLYIDGGIREIILENNSLNEELLGNLIGIGLVSSYKGKEQDKISAYAKRNKPESKVEVKLL